METDRLVHLVYVSSATRLMTDAELVELLRQCRINNSRRDITGMLLYKDGNFIQALEGPERDVVELHTRIARDPRHRQMLTLLREPTEQRDFAGWSMGFRNLDALEESDRESFNTFLQAPAQGPQPGDASRKVWKLLLSFKRNMR
jgi:hypothetical protein